MAELPVVVPDVVEYQLHRLTCPCCHISTCGTLPPDVKGQFGPRLEATLALLASQYRQGLRPVVGLSADLWGLNLSTGMVSKLRQRTADALLVPWAQVVVGRGLRGSSNLRPSQVVLVDQTLAVVLVAFAAGLPGDDRPG